MYHGFKTEDAEKYGIEEAVIIEHLRFWIIKNRANGTHFHDGHYWTYSSIEALTTIFPYLSYKQIRRALSHLQSEVVIVSGNYNQIAYDHTKWYAFVDEDCLLPPFDLPRRANHTARKGRPIPDSLTDSIQIKSVDTPEEVISPDFDPTSINLEEAIFGRKDTP